MKYKTKGNYIYRERGIRLINKQSSYFKICHVIVLDNDEE